jgi:hypothetical protein
MSPFNPSVTHLGIQAKQILAEENIGSVFGLVSRGAYLHFESGWVVFLSSGPYHGPLTVNLDGDFGRLQGLQPGAKVGARAGAIYFSEPDSTIDTDGAPVWAAPAPSIRPLSSTAYKANLATIARSTLARPRAGDPSPLLPALFRSSGLDGELPGFTGQRTRAQHPDLAGLRGALRGDQVSEIVSALEPFLGWGIGLTPAGDDLVIGLLLALNRWGDSLRPDLGVAALNQLMVAAAGDKTTALSASMIRCASTGQADERLIRPLDGIMTGDPDPALSAAYLGKWGHSSGSDALAGMALAVMR